MIITIIGDTHKKMNDSFLFSKQRSFRTTLFHNFVLGTKRNRQNKPSNLLLERMSIPSFLESKRQHQLAFFQVAYPVRWQKPIMFPLLMDTHNNIKFCYYFRFVRSFRLASSAAKSPRIMKNRQTNNSTKEATAKKQKNRKGWVSILSTEKRWKNNVLMVYAIALQQQQQ